MPQASPTVTTGCNALSPRCLSIAGYTPRDNKPSISQRLWTLYLTGYTVSMERQPVNVETMDKIAVEFATHLKPNNEVATVVTLSGELGAGKTTFARAVARAFGIEESITSPTFVIEKIYAPTFGQFSRLIHIDAYRLNGAHELEVLGWRELLREPGNLILLEWPEKVAGAIPAGAIHVSLTFVDENTRTISYE